MYKLITYYALIHIERGMSRETKEDLRNLWASWNCIYQLRVNLTPGPERCVRCWLWSFSSSGSGSVNMMFLLLLFFFSMDFIWA